MECRNSPTLYVSLPVHKNSHKDVIYFEMDTMFYYIIGTNLLAKKNAPPSGSHVLQPTNIIFELVQDIIGMNLLIKFHEDRTVNVASRVHVFKANIIIFKLIQDIIEINLLTKFHEDWTINLASRVLTRFYYSHIRKNAPPPGGHVFQPTGIIFELLQDIIGMNLLTKFHEGRTINVDCRVKNAPPFGSHVFQAKFHEDRKINVASRVLTRFYYSHRMKNAPPPDGHVLQPTDIIFELVQDIIGMNLLTKFHEDLTINVVSRVKNAPPLAAIRKNVPPLGSHVFQANVTIFQDIIETNLLTKFHEDWK
ncbi:hypothetical protein DPMN_081431 [Dreissena polymorpha]|uniref:Uncharacterized protein n=1 Tax=Dreissena polymorpha TaxID=45954 RepID=A0A9D3Y8T4_DREPO|nr:hypothetical protein DPMN_081431 [Dreissena polymorpha]